MPYAGILMRELDLRFENGKFSWTISAHTDPLS